MFGDFDLIYLTNKTTIISKNKERKKGFDLQIIVFLMFYYVF